MVMGVVVVLGAEGGEAVGAEVVRYYVLTL